MVYFVTVNIHDAQNSEPTSPFYLNKMAVRPIEKDILFHFWSIKRYGLFYA